MKRLLLFLVVQVFLFQYLTAQTTEYSPIHENIIPPSPEAADMGKYSEIKVNHHTGTPNISIPIHTIQGKNLQHAINLTYDASGRKVTEIASPVGLGWTLQAGGVITRTVRGLPDELSVHGYFDIYQEWLQNDYQTWFETTFNNPFTQSQLTHGAYTLMTNVYNGISDMQPDVFNYNFNGYQGKIMFLMDETTYEITPIVTPHQNIKVERDPNNFGSIYDSWTITTEDGSVYQFDYGDAELSTTTGPAGTYVSTWHLSSIKDRNDTEEIVFHYQTITGNDPIPVFKVNNVNISQYSQPPPQGPYEQCVNNVPAEYVFDDQVTYTTRYLDFIVFKDQRVDFISSIGRDDYDATFTPKLRRLVSIDVENPSLQQTLKSIIFSHSYFGTQNKRLRLDGLTEVGKPPYVFEYYPGLLPGYNSNAQDHWGYFNNAPNTTLVPPPDPDYINSGNYIPNSSATANREANHAVSNYSMLKKIIYPTGGFAQYEYEGHKKQWTETMCDIDMTIAVAAYGNSVEHGSHSVLENTIHDYIDDGDTYAGDVYVRAKEFIFQEQQYVQFYRNISPTATYAYPTGLYLMSAPLSQTSWDNRTVLNSNQIIQLNQGTYYLIAVVEDATALEDVVASATATYYETYIACDRTQLIGGARLKKVTLNDGIDPANNLTEEYFYYNNVHNLINQLGGPISFAESSTYLYQMPKYYELKNCGILYGSAFSANPYSRDPGNHVGYAEVGVLKKGKENGFSVYKYSTSYNPNVRGNPTEEIYYKWNGTGLEKIKEVKKDYKYIYPKGVTGYRFDVNRVEYCHGCGGNYNVFEYDQNENGYKYGSFATVIESEVMTSIENGVTMSDTTSYYYDFVNNTSGPELSLPTRIENTSSYDSIKTYKKLFYPYSFSASQDSAILQLKDDYVPAKVIRDERGYIESGNYYKTFEQIVKPVISGSRIFDEEVFHYSAGVPELSDTTYETNLSFSIQDYRLIAEFEYHGSNDLPVYSKRIDGVETTYLWGYDNSFPVAEVKNAKFQDVQNALSVTLTQLQDLDGQALIDALAPLRSSFPDSQVTILTHIPYVGVSSITDMNGKTQTFEYDDLNRLVAIRDHEGLLVKVFDYQYNQTYSPSN